MNTFTKISSGAFALALFIGVNAPSVQADEHELPNVVDAAIATPALSTLVDLVVKADLVDALIEADDITVFAPTNDAFNKLPRPLLNAVLNNDELLTQILLYHVAPGRLSASQVVSENSIDTLLEGAAIHVRVAGNNVFLNGNTRVTATDIETSNATVHTINRVLIPWHNVLGTVMRELRRGA